MCPNRGGSTIRFGLGGSAEGWLPWAAVVRNLTLSVVALAAALVVALPGTAVCEVSATPSTGAADTVAGCIIVLMCHNPFSCGVMS